MKKEGKFSLGRYCVANRGKPSFSVNSVPVKSSGGAISLNGAVSSTGTVSQPFQWSSEYHDPELSLTYYNFRHYNPTDGRWLTRDMIKEQENYSLYAFVVNSSISHFDVLGLTDCIGKSCNEHFSLLDILFLRERGLKIFERGLCEHYSKLSKYKCTFIITYSRENNTGKFDTKAVSDKVQEILRKVFNNKDCLNIKVSDDHKAEFFVNLLNEEKCICGIIYIGHSSRTKGPSRLIFDNDKSIATRTEENKKRICGKTLKGDYFLPGNFSALFGCESAAGNDSITEQLAGVFKGTVIGSINKLNFDGGDPYTPFRKGRTLFMAYSSRESPKDRSECCCHTKGKLK